MAVRHVLLVDDDDIGRGVLAVVLRQTMQAKVVETRSAIEALVALESGSAPALIVLDALMPGMSGYELCRQLRADQRWTSLPIALLSARSGPDAISDGLESGATCVLCKPFDPLTIGNTLMEIVVDGTQLRAGCSDERCPPGCAGGDVIAQAVASLRPKFLHRLTELAERFTVLSTRWRAGDSSVAAEFQLLVHRLAGTAGSYGLHEISHCAKDIDLALQQEGLEHVAIKRLPGLIEMLREAAAGD